MTRIESRRENELNMITGGGEPAEELAGFFRVFGDAGRLRILARLTIAPLNVGDLARELGMTQSAVSHQLRTLKDSRLVRARKEGKEVYYEPDDRHIETILADGLTHTRELRQGRR